MTESEFAALGVEMIDGIEDAIDATDINADIDRKAEGVLEIGLAGGKIVVNVQVPMRQIWVAAKSGGFHFALESGRWQDTRSGEPLMDLLSRVVSAQAGVDARL